MPNAELPLVPQPARVQHLQTTGWHLGPDSTISATGEAEPIAELLAERWRTSTGFALPIANDPGADLQIVLDPAADARPESYQLRVADGRATITARTAHGAYNGTLTLRQLLPPAAEADRPADAEWLVPAVEIADAPRFGYRGVMLDVARSFLTVAEVKAYLDTLAALKLNYLHLHLTDDQGWRIEITNEGRAPGDTIDYARLTEVSGATAVTERGYRDEPGHTGFYTQDDYRDIVAYARRRFVTIVPEVDVPSHINAALHAIPELNSDGSLPARDPGTGVVPARTDTAVGYSALDEHHEPSYVFCAHVFAQLSALTGGPYVHIGGDECNDMGRERLRSFITRAVPRVRAAVGDGVGVMGWTEYAEAGLDQGAGYWDGCVVQYWVGSGDWVRDFVAKGGMAVVSDAEGAYLDQKYDARTPFGLEWTAPEVRDVDRYYGWDPTTAVDGGLAEEHILGVEAPLWSETVRGLAQAYYLTLPRAAAVLEIGWTAPELKDFDSFARRLAACGARWAAGDVTFYPSPLVPWPAEVADLGWRP